MGMQTCEKKMVVGLAIVILPWIEEDQ